MITLKDVKKTYTNGVVATHALREINMHVGEGEFLAIVGASGSGKTTLLNIIGGMDTLTEGKYFFQDIAVHNLKMRQLHQFRKEHVGFVFQQFALMNHYTVYQNVELPLLAKNIRKSERKKRVMEQLEWMGIEGLAKKLPIHISGGQQQRCAIARALVADNPLLIADEPTGALDKNTGQEIIDIFKKINQKGVTVILVTHDENIAYQTKRIVRVEDGIIKD